MRNRPGKSAFGSAAGTAARPSGAAPPLRRPRSPHSSTSRFGSPIRASTSLASAHLVCSHQPSRALRNSCQRDQESNRRNRRHAQFPAPFRRAQPRCPTPGSWRDRPAECPPPRSTERILPVVRAFPPAKSPQYTSGPPPKSRQSRSLQSAGRTPARTNSTQRRNPARKRCIALPAPAGTPPPISVGRRSGGGRSQHGAPQRHRDCEPQHGGR